MKNLILRKQLFVRLTPILILLLITVNNIYSQKLYTNYSIYYENGDSIKISEKSFNRDNIYKLVNIKGVQKDSNQIKKIIDSDNRIFCYISFLNKVFLVEQLESGYIDLYAGMDNLFYVKHDSTIYLLESKVSEENGYSYETKKYKGILILLANDPNYSKEINKTEFNEDALLKVVQKINGKKGKSFERKKMKKQFLLLSIGGSPLIKTTTTTETKGTENITNTTKVNYFKFDILWTDYYPSISSNTSVRFGFSGSYFHGKDNDGDFYSKYLCVPVLFYFEKTTSTITPYGYLGFAPMLYSWDDGTKLGVDILCGFGLKCKPSDNFNFRVGMMRDINLIKLDFGVEFVIK